MNSKITDAHAHCGTLDRFPPQDFDDYFICAQECGVERVVMFAPVIEIYDRHDPDFKDDPQWRRRRKNANEYLLTVGNEKLEVIPYFFMWNDFAIEQLNPAHQGIKWHRHSNEPEYHYQDPRCSIAIDEIRRRNLPVVFEEEFHNTLQFINDIAEGVRVIIPHLGLLNGGYETLVDAGIWENPNVYADTALAPSYSITHYLKTYGDERIMFGSDFPFGNPKSELDKILNLDISSETRERIIGANLELLLAENTQ